MTTLLQALRKLDLQDHIKMASKMADNQYSELDGFSRLYVDSVGGLLKCKGISLHEAKQYAVKQYDDNLLETMTGA